MNMVAECELHERDSKEALVFGRCVTLQQLMCACHQPIHSGCFSTTFGGTSGAHAPWSHTQGRSQHTQDTKKGGGHKGPGNTKKEKKS